MTQERELDSGLNDGELSRLYAEAPQIEPPEHLDAAILAEAHRAVSARPAASRKRRWAIPLGLVASLFVVVMVGLQLPYMLKEPSSLQTPVPASVAPRAEESAAQPAPAEARAADKSATANKPVAPLAAAPTAPPAPEVAPEPAMAARQLELREREESASMGALAKEKRSAYTGGSNDDLKQLAPAAAAVAPPPAKLERALMQDETGAVALRPQEWLKRIGKLKQEGKAEEARKELEAFRKRYPDYPVPAGLN